MLDHEADDQLALDHEADDQLALDHEADDQLALDQEADDQLALDQEAAFQAGSADAAAVQAVASKVLFVTKRLRPAFGLACPSVAIAPATLTMPTPIAPTESYPAGTLALAINAPLTWSGVQSGCREITVAAAPDTIGAANDVPDIHM